jgi:hypothetical protein
MKRFSQSELRDAAHECADKVLNSKTNIDYFSEPYQHLVIDGFFNDLVAASCLSSFPSLDQPGWDYQNDSDVEVKYRTTWSSEFDIPDGLVDAVRVLNSSVFLRAMSDRMGIAKIIPDPYFTGGGLNVTSRGGLLDVHVDGNYHDATGLNRRLNAILYLNPHWKSDWGGEFGVYDSTGRRCVKRIAPLFNRLIIFETHDFSFHGLPDPINFPAGELRRSIILYYYTVASRPTHQVSVSSPHSALWVKRGLLDKKGKKTRESI